MDLALRGRVAVVIGGTSGIGLATVWRLLDEGASVAFCAGDADQVAAVAAEVGAAHGRRVMGGVADGLDETALGAFRDAVDERFGRVDILIDTADGAASTTFLTLLRRSPSATIVHARGGDADGRDAVDAQAVELAPDIRVAGIRLGAGDASDDALLREAAAIAFVASPMCGFVSGSLLAISGRHNRTV